MLEGLVKAFSEAIFLKDQSLMWTEGHLDLAEVGVRSVTRRTCTGCDKGGTR